MVDSKHVIRYNGIVLRVPRYDVTSIYGAPQCSTVLKQDSAVLQSVLQFHGMSRDSDATIINSFIAIIVLCL